MDLTFNEHETEFRNELRAWLALNPPGGTPDGDGHDRYAWLRDWQRRLHEGGWAGVDWPVEYGGRGATLTQSAIFFEELARARAPLPVNVLGLLLGGPTLMRWGTAEQKERFLPPILSAEEIWCQGFSEPDAGSDLASLKTHAVRDGDDWVVTGQKVWTSGAQYSKWCMLVARTDLEAPKHKGLTYFLMDMEQDQVQVRPLRQITGEAEFNEVYITEVRVPDADRIGEVGEGWRVAMTTLMNERTTIGGGGGAPERGSGAIAEAVRIWQEEAPVREPAARDRLVKLWIEAEALRLTNIRASQNRKAGNPGPEGSIAKLMFAEVNKRIYELCLDLLGPSAMVGYDFTMKRAESLGLVGPAGWSRKMFLRSRANSIEGGTSEIQRNILGERVLGLPGDVRVDKDVPWSKVPR